MSLANDAFGWALTKTHGIFAGDAKTAPADWDDYWYQALGTTSATGIHVTPELALSTSAFFACVMVISETLASLPLPLYRRLEGGGKERATDHPVFGLLRWRPNRWQTPVEFWEMMVGHACLRPMAYAEVIWNAHGFPEELIPLHPDRVTPKRMPNGDIVYEIREQAGPIRRVHMDRIFRFGGMSQDGLQGVNRTRHAREAVGLALAQESYAGRFFKNNASPRGVLQTDKSFKSEDAREKFRASWEKTYGGLSQSHKVGILEAGLKWQNIGMSARDSALIEGRKLSNFDIARFFRMQPHKIGLMDKATLNNIQEQNMEFLSDTMRPWFIRVQQAVTRSLLLPEERVTYFAEFLTAAMLMGDIKTRYESYSIGRNGGWLSVNEIRGIENMNPIAGGDEYLVPLNMAPAGQGALAERARLMITDVAGRLNYKEFTIVGKASARDDGKFPEWARQAYRHHAADIARMMQVPMSSAEAWASLRCDEVIAAFAEDRLDDFLADLEFTGAEKLRAWSLDTELNYAT